MLQHMLTISEAHMLTLIAWWAPYKEQIGLYGTWSARVLIEVKFIFSIPPQGADGAPIPSLYL